MILAESLNNTLEGVFFSKVVTLLDATGLEDELLDQYFSIILYTFGEHLL